MSLLVEQWSTTPADNSDPPPNGAPETTMKIKELNDTIRVMMASQREIYDGLVTGSDAVLANMPGGANLEIPVPLPDLAWAPYHHFKGLNVLWDQLNRVTVEPGECTNLANDTPVIRLNSSITKLIDSTWVDGNFIGGLAAGVTLNDSTWYHFFLIWDPTTGNINAGYDSAINAANLMADPAVISAGYTKYRRICTVFYQDVTVKMPKFFQEGNRFYLAERVRHAGLSDASTSLLVPVRVPLGLKVVWIGWASLRNSDFDVDGWFSSPDENDISTRRDMRVDDDCRRESIIKEVLTNKNSQIRWRTTAGATGSICQYDTIGWIDERKE